ncbi:MAG: hypothetical protein KAS02_01405 [Candidatus Pacebacteria bacterium]|nr:hypothetical protein [Candidatus Paceibacterota bacterium]
MFAFKQLEEKFLSIPEDIREAISSNEVNERLLTLAHKYELQYDEAEELTKEIGYIMLGLKPKTNFIKNIQKATQLDFKKSKTLAEEINNTIFTDIRESLKQIHKLEEEHDENLDEDLVREELLNEISNTSSTTKYTESLENNAKVSTDLIKTPENKEMIISSEKNTKLPETNKQTSQSPVIEKQKEEKSYTIDPYREPLD